MLQHNTALGQLGETQALSYLLSQQYLIKDTNISFPCGEIDIVAYDPVSKELVFVEVKTRSQPEFGHPSHSVSWKKKRALIKSALTYRSRTKNFHDFRFDIITVSPANIAHFQNISLE